MQGSSLQSDYQSRLIAAMIASPETGHIAAKIPASHYDAHHRELVRTLHAYLEDARKDASKDRCLEWLQQNNHRIPDPIQKLIEVDADLVGVDKTLVFNIERKMAVTDRLKDLVGLIEEEEYEQAASLLNVHTSEFEEPVDVVEFGENQDESRNNPVPMPFGVLNDLTQGGLCAGELGVILGPTGGGKSAWLIGIGCYAAYTGSRVLFITLELSQAQAAGRCVGWLTHIPEKGTIQALKDRASKMKEIKATMAENGGSMHTHYVAPYSTTLPAVLRQLDADKYDLIIVDAPEHLRVSKPAQEERMRLNAMLGDILACSAQYAAPIWVSWQCRKDAYGRIPEKEDVGETLKIAKDATLILGMKTLSEGDGEATVNMKVAKNRVGPEGAKVSFEVDFSTCRFVEIA